MAGSGIALKALQWFNRGVLFLCAALILAIYSYFMAMLSRNNQTIDNSVRAVEGISGFAALYSALGILLVCCFAGLKFTTFIAIVLDVAFAAAFIFVAVANKHGVGSCEGTVTTPFGTGPSSDTDPGNHLTLRTACKLESACLAVSIVAILFFLFAAGTEVLLGRHHHKESRFGPGPANGYTQGSGGNPRAAGRGGVMGWIKGKLPGSKPAWEEHPDKLPEHTDPSQVGATELSPVAPQASHHSLPRPAHVAAAEPPLPYPRDSYPRDSYPSNNQMLSHPNHLPYPNDEPTDHVYSNKFSDSTGPPAQVHGGYSPASRRLA